MIINDYKFDGTFIVEFIPEDPELTSYTYGITLPYHETPSPTKDEIISRIAGGSPQDFWNYEIESKKFNDTERMSLKGSTIENAHNLMPVNMLASLDLQKKEQP